MNAWRNLMHRREVERDVDDEMRFHIEMEANELMRRGVPEAEARRQALLSFGGIEQQKEEARATRAGHTLDQLQGDVHFAWRWLQRSPVFAATAIITLALGIGSATVIFGAADYVLLRPLPYSEPDRVVTIWETDSREAGRLEMSPGNFAALKQRALSYTHLGLAEPGGFDLIERGAAHSVNSWTMTEGFAEAIGVRPALGQLFRPVDYLPGAAPVVLIGDHLWRNRFDSDPNIVGRSIRLNEMSATIIGVLPADLPWPDRRDVWAPKSLNEDELGNRTSRYQVAVGRLKDGASIDDAAAEASAVARSLAAQFPRSNHSTSLAVVSIADHVLGNVRLALLVLAGGVACLLLIACANIANLLLARALEREREIAIRAAIGASRRRIGRQMLTESALLCLCGGIGGVIVAALGVQALKAISPPDLPRIEHMQLDLRMLLVAALVTFATACVVGIMPALRLPRFDLLSRLRSGGRAIGSGANTRTRSALVVAEIALAIVLLTGTGLLARSFVRLLDNDLGFDPQHRVEAQTFLWDRTNSGSERIERVRAIERELARVRGVDKVGATTVLPFHPHQITMLRELIVAGRGADQQNPRTHVVTVTPGYFDVMSMEISRGRGFTEFDRDGGQQVAVISEALVSQVFRGVSPLGQRIALRSADTDSLVYREIVGVVNDVRVAALDADAPPSVYTPHAQSGTGSVTFVAQHRPDVRVTPDDMSKAVWRVDPGQAVYHAATVDALVAETLAERRFHLLVLGVFSVIGLILALIGIYGLIAFVVRTRMREFGLRLALGALPRDILSRVLKDALKLSGIGIVTGVVGGLLLSRWLRQMLYEVDPADLTTYVQTAVLMLFASVIAAFIPARRAALTEPLDVLRED